MKTAICIILLVIWFLFIAETTVTFHPFAISMKYWWKPLGLFFIFFGLSILSVGSYQQGRQDGQEEFHKEMIEHLNNKKSYEKK